MTAGQLAAATGLPRERIAPELSKLVKTGELVKADRGYKTPASKATPNGTPPPQPTSPRRETALGRELDAALRNPHLIDRAPRTMCRPGLPANIDQQHEPSPVDHGNDMSPVDADACAPSSGDGSVADASPTGSERLTTRRPSEVKGDSGSPAPR